MKRAVFLDRDGVVNRAVVREGRPFPPPTLDRLEVLPGVAEALRSLRASGFTNIVVTNQPDVATGEQRRDVVDAMHARLLGELALDAIRACFHVDADACQCRKPKPGMLVDAAREFRLDLTASYLVGDRWRDIAAGQAVGATCFFIDYGYAERRPEPPYVAVKSLSDAVEHILRRDDRNHRGRSR